MLVWFTEPNSETNTLGFIGSTIASLWKALSSDDRRKAFLRVFEMYFSKLKYKNTNKKNCFIMTEIDKKRKKYKLIFSHI